jgi:pSer/pThr/pTyr-binding forkhead associated (FHA) protein
MSAKITFTAIQGGLEGREFTLAKRGRYIMGRAEDCDLCLYGGNLSSVSRHHCLLDVEPPGISVRDLGSRNGTFVNGALIGRRSLPDPLDDFARDDGFMAYELNDGDELRLGQLIFRVSILDTSDAAQPLYAPAGLS